MNVHDWLANLPFSDPESGCRIIEVSFNNGSRKDFYRNITLHHYEKGDMIAVEGVSGFDVGMVNMTGERFYAVPPKQILLKCLNLKPGKHRYSYAAVPWPAS